MDDVVLVHDDGGIRVITLNRPARLNAINPALLEALNRALASAQEDPAIGAIVLTGAGRAFCAGDDLIDQQSMMDADEITIRHFVESIQDVTRNIMFGGTPVVGAIQGWAVGGAFSWPINCDLSVWSEEAKAFFPELKIGLFVSGGVTYLLPKVVGSHIAREMIYLGPKYEAGTLRELGLATEVVPKEHLLDVAMDRARQLALIPAWVRQQSKQALVAPDREALERALEQETEVVVDCLLDPETYTRIQSESGLGRRGG